jgi:eukaryotic-like serine/threonine-protein kinase
VYTLPKSVRRHHPFFWFVLTYSVIVAIIFTATAFTIKHHGWPYRNVGWKFEFRTDAYFVSYVDPNGPIAGKLQQGDRIIALNGDTSFRPLSIRGPMTLHINTDTYTLRIVRGSNIHDFRLESSLKYDLPFLFSLLVLFLAATMSYVAATVVGFSKPEHRTTQLFFCGWMSESLLQLMPVLKLMESSFGFSELRLAEIIWFFSFSPLTVAAGYDFYHRFPSGLNESSPWPLLKRAFYVYGGVLAAFFTVTRLKFILNPQTGADFYFRNSNLMESADRLSDLMVILTLAAVCGVVRRNYRTVTEPDLQRRIRWVVYGSVVGILPFLIFFIGKLVADLKGPLAPTQHQLDQLFLIANISLVVIPTTVGYAILKHRMFNIQIVIRRGVHYLMAKSVLQIFLYLPLVWIIYTIRANRSRSILELLTSNSLYLILVFAAIAGLLFRKSLLHLLDRKFFREAYNSEKILMTLVDQIKNFNSMSEVASWVSLQVKSALHPKKVLVFYREKDQGAFALAYSSREQRRDLRIPDSFELLRIARKEGKAHDLVSSEKYSLPQYEKEWLEHQEIHFLVPMAGTDERLHGVLLLGEKRSEEPYSNGDRKLLETLAAQMGVLYENLLLKERIDEGQRVQREVLAHLSEQKRNLVKECPSCGTCFDSSAEVCSNDNQELVLSLPVDRTIDGKYRLDRLIGRGGMGAVYRTTDLRLNREVAVKIMIGSAFGDGRAFRRFEREARASARLNHPNVITVYDFGDIGGGAYLVMELLQGHTLREAIRQKGNLSPDTVANLFNQILEGTKAAHQMGIIHRDLKPENILITRDEQYQLHVKVLDFGLAKMKLMDAPRSITLTAPGAALGTIHYMSPEQITGDDVDERTDIFALGVMVIESLTGRLPFTGKTPTEIALSIIQKDFELKGDSAALQQLNSVIQKCIAKDRDSRFSSVNEMQKALIGAIRNCPPFAKPEDRPQETDTTTPDITVL